MSNSGEAKGPKPKLIVPRGVNKKGRLFSNKGNNARKDDQRQEWDRSAQNQKKKCARGGRGNRKQQLFTKDLLRRESCNGASWGEETYAGKLLPG